MKGRLNSRVWILWMTATMLFTILTFHPVYLALLTLTLVFVSRNYNVRTVDIIRIGVVFGIPLLLVNVFFVHTGEHTIFEIPRNVQVLGHDLKVLVISGPITAESILNGLVFVLLMVNMFLIFSVFNKATSPDSLIRIIPNYLSKSALLVGIALKFVPTLTEDLRSIGDAQRCRGLDLDEGNVIKRARRYTGLVIPTVVNSLERSYNLAEAIESRGFGSKRSRYVNEDWGYGDLLNVFWLLILICSFFYFKFNGYLEGWSVLYMSMKEGTSINPFVVLSILALVVPTLKK